MFPVIMSSGDLVESPKQERNANEDEKSCHGIWPDRDRRPDKADPDVSQEGPDKEHRHIHASLLRALTLMKFPETGKQFRADKSEPKPDKEAGSHVIHKQPCAKTDQDGGRNDESRMP